MSSSVITVPGVASPANAIPVPTPLNFVNPANVWSHQILRGSALSYRDLSGNGNDLIPLGGSPSFETDGATLTDGSRLDTGYLTDAPFAIGVVAYWDGVSLTSLFGNYTSNPSNGYMGSISATSNQVRVTHAPASPTPGFTSTPLQPIAAAAGWHFVMLAIGGGSARLYVPTSTDGTPMFTTGYATPQFSNTNMLLNGKIDNFGSGSCKIAEVMIFDYAMTTDAELTAAYTVARSNMALIGITLP